MTARVNPAKMSVLNGARQLGYCEGIEKSPRFFEKKWPLILLGKASVFKVPSPSDLLVTILEQLCHQRSSDIARAWGIIILSDQ